MLKLSYKLSNLIAQNNVAHSKIVKFGFANLKVKIDYSEGCENKEILELVESELYNKYRLTFGDHNITIDAQKTQEHDGKFTVDVKIDDKENQRIWDDRKHGSINNMNVHKLTEIIEEKLQQQKQR